MNMRNYSTLHFERDIALLYSTIAVAVGYSTMSKICTRIRKSKKDKKTQWPKEKDKRTNNDQQNIRITKLLNQWFLLDKVEVNIFNVRTVAIMTWLSTTEYLCQKWPRICSTCRKHFPVPSSFMTYHLVCNYIKMTAVTIGAGTAYPLKAPELIPGF